MLYIMDFDKLLEILESYLNFQKVLTVFIAIIILVMFAKDWF